MVNRPGGNPRAKRQILISTPIQMLPRRGSICGRLTRDFPMGCLQGEERGRVLADVDGSHFTARFGGSTFLEREDAQGAPTESDFTEYTQVYQD
jgi:hypothetical protein